MGVTVKFDDELAQTLYYEFADKWNWTEYLAAFEQELVLVKDLDRYDVIANLLPGDYFPGGPGLTSLYSTFRRTPPTMKLLVIVTGSRAVHYILNLMKKIYPEMINIFQVVSTMEEARQILRQRGSQSLTHL
ncbi:MAG TPA: hypothetical protein VHL11_08675 [Phototrophicaceae bacterium]|jgi:hypothetical protein|nr:hypothetical protein [Phototrophicaceae bacterium]